MREILKAILPLWLIISLTFSSLLILLKTPDAIALSITGSVLLLIVAIVGNLGGRSE